MSAEEQAWDCTRATLRPIAPSAHTHSMLVLIAVDDKHRLRASNTMITKRQPVKNLKQMFVSISSAL